MNLSEEQQAAFARTNELLGLGAFESSAMMADQEYDNLPQERVMSSGPDSHFPAHVVSVGSIAQMREIAGFSPKFNLQKDGAGPPPPKPLSERDANSILASIKKRDTFKADIPEDIEEMIRQAAETYVMGNPEEVTDYVPLINATLFPGRIAAFTGNKLSIPEGAKHIIRGDDPVVLNFGEIKIAKNATIRVETTFFIQSQITTME